MIAVWILRDEDSRKLRIANAFIDTKACSEHFKYVGKAGKQQTIYSIETKRLDAPVLIDFLQGFEWSAPSLVIVSIDGSRWCSFHFGSSTLSFQGDV